MADFVAHYKDPKDPFGMGTADVQHYEAFSKQQVLQIAQTHATRERHLAFISIDRLGSQNQVWNAMRAARPEQKGNGWIEEMLPPGFPEE